MRSGGYGVIQQARFVVFDRNASTRIVLVAPPPKPRPLPATQDQGGGVYEGTAVGSPSALPPRSGGEESGVAGASKGTVRVVIDRSIDRKRPLIRRVTRAAFSH